MRLTRCLVSLTFHNQQLLTSLLEGLRSKLENVDLARKTASDQAENNKKLVEGKQHDKISHTHSLYTDIRDTYEDKLASLAKKCEQWRREADKQNETAKRLREERNKCKSCLVISCIGR